MATAKYDRENTRRINLKLNNRTDADIILKLENTENIQGYIKSLIRADIEKEEPKMKKWYMIDNALTDKGEIYETELKASSKEEAMKQAMKEWNALSDRDQANRDEFYIGLASEDEDGCVDYNTMTDIEYIKK